MRYIKVFILVFFLSCGSLALAERAVDLSEHGKDLMKAPFVARYQFYEIYHKDWLRSTYSERKFFLTQWHKNLIAEDKKEAAQAKEEARLERDKINEKRAMAKAEQDRLKAQALEAKDETKDFDARQKDFNERVKSSQKDIEELQKHSNL